MANPQWEKGFTKIADDIMDALIRTNITGGPRQVLDAIIRMTYGYGRTWQEISLNTFRKMTGISKSHICHHIKSLINMQIIVAQIGNRNLTSYRIQKDYDKWKSLPKQATEHKPLPKQATTVAQIGNAPPRRASKDKGLQTPIDNLIDNKDLCSFDGFWIIYPKKRAKKDAFKVWLKLKPDLTLTEEIVLFIEKAKQSVEWTKNGGQFIPYPTTFLNGQRWKDELTYKEDFLNSYD